ncbi:Por secretion system C-terminal sorting domain-containing protein [Dyadobacter soli]|uniref:Por secretion system C-terminal sorting domain-containing protein n=1 Tax=Dyadobacter soli TaxID=659014 RepID=A0A1G6YCN5_9BACT|nr:T9SS type A sorting domain-containing protein [Dyadobacter soli]SDD88100.1 Por secretion system C-terminal sorting domain-containing protein [Dyadobacter soli]
MCLLLIGMTDVQAQKRKIFTDRVKFGAVTYPSTATVTANMVDGYVKMKGSNRFIFPVSDNSVYRPFAASADGTMGAYFSGSVAVAVTTSHKGGNYPPLPAGAPFSVNSKDANVGKVSTREYWDINGTNATKISFAWYQDSGLASLAPGGNLSKVYIVGWNGSKWVKIPTTVDAVSILGGSSTITMGSMTTNAAIVPNTYLAYTFGADLSTAREMAPGADSTLIAADGTEILKPENSSMDEVEAAVYPNPAFDRIFIRSNRKVKQVSVWDMSGRRMLTTGSAYENGIEVKGVPAGTYVVNIEDDKGKTTSRKIIINK